jgi:hypothetical protein
MEITSPKPYISFVFEASTNEYTPHRPSSRRLCFHEDMQVTKFRLRGITRYKLAGFGGGKLKYPAWKQ